MYDTTKIYNLAIYINNNMIHNGHNNNNATPKAKFYFYFAC